MPDPVTIELAGRRFGGWTAVSVTRSIEAVTGSFDLGATENAPGDPPERPLQTGLECTVRIGEDTVITGYTDELDIRIDGRAHGISLRGRDATGDLADCSAINKPGTWTKRKVEAIASDLAAPFGVKVTADVDTGAALRRFALNQGETAFEAIERMCRLRALLPLSDGLGGLRLTRAGETGAGTPIIEGRNMLTGTALYSDRDRFSEYTVKGQQAGDSAWTAAASTGSQGKAYDPAIFRTRTLDIIAEVPGDSAAYGDRAKWEAARRAGRGVRVTATVAGWRDSTGRLWRPNTTVRMKSPALAVNRTMLISTVTLREENGGRTAVLGLSRPEAFQLIPLKDKEEAGLWTIE